jgi:hypothetical protein
LIKHAKRCRPLKMPGAVATGKRFEYAAANLPRQEPLRIAASGPQRKIQQSLGG